MDDETNAIEVTRQTYDLIASDYSSMIDELVSDSWIGEFEGKLLDRFLLTTKLLNPSILDIGCGNGKDTHYLRQKGAVLVGMDISSGMLREARKRVPEGIFYQMDMRNLGFSAAVFDGVWANGCIYHVPKIDFAQVLKEVLRVLGPLGTFSFNFKVGIGERLEETPGSFAGGPRFYAYYTIKQMASFLAQAGFEILEIKRYPQRILGEKIVHIWACKLK